MSISESSNEVEVVAQLFCVAQSVKSIRFHSRCSIELKSDDKRQWSAKKDSFGHENATEIEKGPKNPINPSQKYEIASETLIYSMVRFARILLKG